MVAAFLLAGCHQNGTVFTVDITSDSVDANPGDGLCADDSGSCSVRAAVMEANALPGVEEIRLMAGETHLLSIDGGYEDEAATGDLDITEAVVITGDGAIDATAIHDRIFHVQHPSGLAELVGIDLRGTAMTPGNIQVGSILSHEGDGILVVSETDMSGTSHPLLGSVVDLGGPAVLWASSVQAEAIEGNPLTVSISGSENVNLWNVTVAGATTATNPDSNLAVGVYPAGEPSNVNVRHSTILGAWVGGATITGSVVEECLTEMIYTFDLPSSSGRNIETATSCGFTQPDDQQNTDPLLGPMADNGGAVPTALPASGSPAIDTGACDLALDARLSPRPSGASCDSGAVEVQSAG